MFLGLKVVLGVMGLVVLYWLAYFVDVHVGFAVREGWLGLDTWFLVAVDCYHVFYYAFLLGDGGCWLVLVLLFVIAPEIIKDFVYLCVGRSAFRIYMQQHGQHLSKIRRISLLNFPEHFLKLRFQKQKAGKIIAVHSLGKQGRLKHSHTHTEHPFFDQTILPIDSIEIKHLLGSVEIFRVQRVPVIFIVHVIVDHFQLSVVSDVNQMRIQTDSWFQLPQSCVARLYDAPELVLVEFFTLSWSGDNLVHEGDLGVLVDHVQFMDGWAQSLNGVGFDPVNSKDELAAALLAIFLNSWAMSLVLHIAGVGILFEEVGLVGVFVLEDDALVIFFDLGEGGEEVVAVLVGVSVAHLWILTVILLLLIEVLFG